MWLRCDYNFQLHRHWRDTMATKCHLEYIIFLWYNQALIFILHNWHLKFHQIPTVGLNHSKFHVQVQLQQVNSGIFRPTATELGTGHVHAHETGSRSLRAYTLKDLEWSGWTLYKCKPFNIWRYRKMFKSIIDFLKDWPWPAWDFPRDAVRDWNHWEPVMKQFHTTAYAPQCQSCHPSRKIAPCGSKRKLDFC